MWRALLLLLLATPPPRMRRPKRLVLSSPAVVRRRNISAPAMATTWKVWTLAAVLVWICCTSRCILQSSSDQVSHLVSKDSSTANAVEISSSSSPPHSHEEERPTLHPIQNRTIMFIHVGKAGGSTLLESFRERHWQDGNVLQRTDVLLPICHMHACKPTIMDRATTWLFVVRNPVERMASAYKFSHPENCMTYDPARGGERHERHLGVQIAEGCARVLRGVRAHAGRFGDRAIRR